MKLLLLLLVLIPLSLRAAQNQALNLWAEKYHNTLRRILRTACFLVLATTVILGLASATRDQVNHDQSTILAIAEAVRHGQPMYPGPRSPVEYSLLYGPATYLLYIPALSLVSTRLTPALLAAAAASSLAFLVVLLALRRRFGWTMGLAGAALLVAFVAPCLNVEWEARGDPWILLAIALGVPSARLRNRWLAALSIAILGALLTNLKFPLLLVGLLPCAELWRRRGGRIPAIAACLLMPILAFIPFAAPEISLRGYADQLGDASRHGFSSHLVPVNLLFGLYLVLPTLCLMWQFRQRHRTLCFRWLRERRIPLVLLLLVLGMAELTGAKHGAGYWHMAVLSVPLAVLDIELFAALLQADRRSSIPLVRTLALPAAFLFVFVGNIALGLARSWSARTHPWANTVPVPMPAVETDLVAVLRKHTSTQFVMGYTDNRDYNFTSPRPLLQVYGIPLVLDGVSRNEADMAHRPITEPLLAAVASCRYPDWILPREGVPFSMKSGYFLDGSIPTPELYSTNFQQDFLDHYRPVESTRYFTLWHCAH